MRKFIAALFISIVTGYLLTAANRTIQFLHLSVEQGLSQSTIWCIYQDKAGFMWFGTNDGLNRYDGNTFKILQHNPNEPFSLSHNEVHTITEDMEGNLWIGTQVGLNKYIPSQGKFIRYRHDPKNPNSLSDDEVKAVYLDETGIVWIGTFNGGLDSLDPATDTFTHYKYETTYAFNRVLSICEGKDGIIWIATSGDGLGKLDINKRKFIKFYKKTPGAVQSICDSFVNNLFYDEAQEVLWIGSIGSGLDRFDPQNETFQHFVHNPSNINSLSNNDIIQIFKDQSGILWISTMDGLNRFNQQKDEFICFKHQPNDPGSMSGDYIFSIFEDRSGALWFGTRGEGLNIFDRRIHKFIYYQHNPNNRNSLSQNTVWNIAEDINGDIWLATEGGGLNKFVPETETFSHYYHDPQNLNTISSDYINVLCGSKFPILWIGTSGRGIDEFNLETGNFTHYRRDPQNPKSLSHGVTLSLYEDQLGTLWVGTRRGLDKFVRAKKEFIHYQPEPGASELMGSNEVKRIYQDKSGIFWLGTRGGLFRFDPVKEEFKCYRNIMGNSQSLSYNEVNTILEDHTGSLWVGTDGGGLNKFDRKTETFTVYTRYDGLPNNIINGILEDNRGNLWISSTKGLSRFTLETLTFRNYSQRSGLQGYEFNAGAYLHSKSGEMFFGGLKGFNRFFPGRIEDNLHIPPIVITSFKIPDKSITGNGSMPLQKEIPFGDKIVLSHKDNIFSIEFAALDYTDPAKNQYKCILEGFNDEWINLGYKNDITFTNLDPKKYIFRVMGTNNDGVWNALGAMLEIYITPPWWETLWFRFLLAGVCCGILFLLYKLRTSRLKEELEKKRLEKELSLKADFTAMLVHDLRSPLTAIIGYSDMLTEMPEQMDVRKTGKVIHRSSEKMLTLINNMLELSKFEAGKMNLEKKNVDITSIVSDIVEIMAPLFKKKDIELICKFDPTVGKNKLSVDMEKIGQVITNFLSNSAKFTPKDGKVVVRTYTTIDGFIEVSVTDNGPGVPPDREEFLFDKYVQFNKGIKTKGTGLGLAVSKLIIESHGGAIGYRPVGAGGGSTFYFRLPLDPNRYLKVMEKNRKK